MNFFDNAIKVFLDNFTQIWFTSIAFLSIMAIIYWAARSIRSETLLPKSPLIFAIVMLAISVFGRISSSKVNSNIDVAIADKVYDNSAYRLVFSDEGETHSVIVPIDEYQNYNIGDTVSIARSKETIYFIPMPAHYKFAQPDTPDSSEITTGNETSN